MLLLNEEQVGSVEVCGRLIAEVLQRLLCADAISVPRSVACQGFYQDMRSTPHTLSGSSTYISLGLAP